MIYRSTHLQQDKNWSADVCVIGTGAGGSAVASDLARNGQKVIMIEAGEFILPKQMNQREQDMFPKLFFEGGARRTRDKSIRVIHGKGVGGSTLHNINLCKKPPKELIDHWDLDGFSYESFLPSVNKVWDDLKVSQIDSTQRNTANELFKKGIDHLGLSGAPLYHNRIGCYQSGFCELGCSFNAKMNALRVYVPTVIENGGTILSETKAQKLHYSNNTITHLTCEVINSEHKKVSTQTIRAKKFISSAGAIESPLLLQRSDIVDPHNQIGKNLRLHPGVVALGVFEQTVNCWQGIPQSYECDQYLQFSKDPSVNRVWLITSSAHPIGASSIVPGFGKNHQSMMKQYPHIVPITPMIHDFSAGSVSSSFGGGVDINYSLIKSDREQLSLGLKKASKILLAAGATKVIIPTRSPIILKNFKEVEKSDLSVLNWDLDMVAVHPMGSLPMGDNPKSSAITTDLRYHHLNNLFVSDASVYPTSLGIPPQISTYASGKYLSSKLI
jgi:choline dehydrogenase-like flavoprotein